MTTAATRPTVAVIAEGCLWSAGVGESPGELLPDAKEKLAQLRLRANVIICSWCASTLTGAQRCRAVIERDLQQPFGYDLDLFVSQGFPVFDELICGCPEAVEETPL